MNGNLSMNTQRCDHQPSKMATSARYFNDGRRWSSVLLLMTFLLLSLSAHAVHPPEIDPFWQPHNESNQDRIDHSAWQVVLDGNLHTSKQDITLFDYANISDADKRQLESYLSAMRGLDPRRYRRAEQMGYWINLYNALTVDLILKNYPTDSITDLGEKFFSFGPWNDPIITIQGRVLTLNDIEHRILRPIWKDNRIHYAVNCASMGCPNLSKMAYTAENTEQQLEQAAYSYVNHPRGVSISGNKLVMSSIYHWYKVDFGGSNGALLEHFKRYADNELRVQLLSFDGDIDHSYDWDLNEL